MTQPADPNAQDSWREELHTSLPGIADEIQGAINTLQKLQQIAGTSVPGQKSDPGIDRTDPSATVDVPGAPAADTDHTAQITSYTPPKRSAKPARRSQKAGVPVLEASESFGRYQIVRVLGQGAMGAVYLAYDSQLERHVALKTPFLGDKPDIIARFYREARAAAQLRSPYICPIYDVGQIGEICYLSMAFIDGQSLAHATTKGGLKDLKAIVAIIAKIARGLQKAHEQGIVHRDLKPDNIMIDGDGEPIVMDFGVARRVDDSIQLTTPGRLIGTPAYMSPEQVEADPAKVGPASDIYTLGVVLYVVITGKLPFQGTLTSVLRQIGSAEPAKPSKLNPEIAEGSTLEKICMKMMAKSPADRYANMIEVAEALEQVFPREAVAVPQPSFWQKLTSWFRGLFAPRAPAPAKAVPATPSASPVKNASSVSSSNPVKNASSVSSSNPAPDATIATAAELPKPASDATLATAAELPNAAPDVTLATSAELPSPATDATLATAAELESPAKNAPPTSRLADS
jgi:serine/threonine protein kinase